ncbi:MAG: alpha-galactosidase [Caldicoprobacterales bacterium]
MLKDPYSHVEVHLYYGVLEKNDIITRAVKVVNKGSEKIVVEKAASLSLDWISQDFDWITFYGRHNMERIPQRSAINHGIQAIGSVRGTSSHHYNPFAILCEKGADETKGQCFGISFVYSGEFLMEVEKDQVNQTRLVCGIHPDNFEWNLLPGEEFNSPEAIMTYSPHGFGQLSRNLHETIREHICRGEWKHKRRPVLVNNWEATYFNFTGDQLVEIAKDAAKLGVELFVLDDGWFGKRDNDNSGLGDWYPNEEKLGCSLKELAERILDTGVEFGIWFEPEAISEDSNLYREHPEWVVRIPGRPPALSRNQLVLDFSRKDVQDYIIERMSDILSEVPITYVKWDFNRSICDKFSNELGPEYQGEFAHRYVLGLYRVLEELTTKFPHILFEGCSGGGGRFDPGMLYYTPHIWCSDNTDPIARLTIQYGTSFGYPVSTVGAHVSTVPNHQTRRVTPFSTRAYVAMSGIFGYQLDISKMTEEEKDDIRKQIEIYKNRYDLIQNGHYYRLLPPTSDMCTVWEIAAKDGKEAIITAVYHNVEANPAPVMVQVQGLNESGSYQLELDTVFWEDKLDEKVKNWLLSKLPYGYGEGELISGAALMKGGLVIPPAFQEYQAWQIIIKQC